MPPGPPPPPPPQGPYGGPPGAWNDTPKTLGIVSLVVGLISIPASCCCWFLGWIPALVAIVTGIIGYLQLPEHPRSDAKPLLICGIVLGVLGLLAVLASFVWSIGSLFYGDISSM